MNVIIEVRHKYSRKFGTYKVDLPVQNQGTVGSRHRNHRTLAKRGSMSTMRTMISMGIKKEREGMITNMCHPSFFLFGDQGKKDQ